MSPSPFRPEDAPTVLPRGPHGLQREVVVASQRGRLLEAFVTLAAERGAHAVSISDIVALAGTAKRTFYEHFRDKQECFLAAFDVGSQAVVAQMTAAIATETETHKRIDAGARAYIDALLAVPDFTRLFLTQMRGAGPELAERWTSWLRTLAEALVQSREESRRGHPNIPALTSMQALGTLAAVNEVVGISLVDHGIDGVPPIADELVSLAGTFLMADTRQLRAGE